MNTAMLGLLAETSIHPGSGRSMGVVDLPVAREATTDYPVLVGSSLKGALRDKANAKGADDVDGRFGKRDHAGDLLVSDGRLLLLPVRSLMGPYRWATCPHLIERYRRDLARAGLDHQPEMPEVKRGSVLARRSEVRDMVAGSSAATGDGSLFLEERQFTIDGEPLTDLTKAIAPLIFHPDTQNRLDTQIAVLHDDDFSWFVRYGLSIQARNNLADDGTKTSKNLWYEETLPPDTVMYALVMSRNGDAPNALEALFPEDDPYLQAGGNETVGQGWFAVRLSHAGSRGAE